MTLTEIKKMDMLFKFSWAQAFSDENGKSSIFSMSCFIAILTGCVGFLYSLFTKSGDGLMYSSGVIAAGLAALTGRKMVIGKPKQLPVIEPDGEEQEDEANP